MHAADGGKDFARRAAELCGVAEGLLDRNRGICMPHMAEKTESEVVQVIGNRLVLFKRNPKEPVVKF